MRFIYLFSILTMISDIRAQRGSRQWGNRNNNNDMFGNHNPSRNFGIINYSSGGGKGGGGKGVNKYEPEGHGMINYGKSIVNKYEPESYGTINYGKNIVNKYEPGNYGTINYGKKTVNEYGPGNFGTINYGKNTVNKYEPGNYGTINNIYGQKTGGGKGVNKYEPGNYGTNNYGKNTGGGKGVKYVPGNYGTINYGKNPGGGKGETGGIMYVDCGCNYSQNNGKRGKKPKSNFKSKSKSKGQSYNSNKSKSKNPVHVDNVVNAGQINVKGASKKGTHGFMVVDCSVVCGYDDYYANIYDDYYHYIDYYDYDYGMSYNRKRPRPRYNPRSWNKLKAPYNVTMNNDKTRKLCLINSNQEHCVAMKN